MTRTLVREVERTAARRLALEGRPSPIVKKPRFAEELSEVESTVSRRALLLRPTLRSAA